MTTSKTELRKRIRPAKKWMKILIDDEATVIRYIDSVQSMHTKSYDPSSTQVARLICDCDRSIRPITHITTDRTAQAVIKASIQMLKKNCQVKATSDVAEVNTLSLKISDALAKVYDIVVRAEPRLITD